MPRRTHPRPVSKHSRAHTRDRARAKRAARWRRTKNEPGLEAVLVRRAPWGYRAQKGLPVDLSTWDRERLRRDRRPVRVMRVVPADVAPLLDQFCARTGQQPPRLLVHPDELRHLDPRLAEFFELRPTRQGRLADRLLYDRYSFVYELEYDYPQRMPGYNAGRRRLARNLADEQDGLPAGGRPGGGSRQFERFEKRMTRTAR